MIKSYSFAGFTLKVHSEMPVSDSGMFRDFICDNGGEEINVKVIMSSLPEKCGSLVYENGNQVLYRDGECDYLYTSFPENGVFREYSCRKTFGDTVLLYIYECDSLWDSMIMEGLKVPELLLKKGVFTVHCSVINIGGEAVIFSADKQMGKSTQAALWEKYRNAEIINGDRAALKVCDGKVIVCGIPFCGSSKIAVNKSLELKAIVFLGKSLVNSVFQLDTLNGFFNFLGKLTYETGDSTQMEKAVDFAKYISENVPLLRLSCLPDESAVITLEEALCQI